MPAKKTAGAHLLHEVLVGGVSNAIFNALAAWLLLRGGSNLTFGGDNSFAIDVVATAFILPFIVSLIVIPLNQRKLRNNKVDTISATYIPCIQTFLNHFPKGLAMRAVCFGVLGVALFSPGVLLPLWALGISEFSPLQYAIFKGFWAGLLAAVLVVPMILLALRKN
ncbi:MAG: hypothetical protein ACI9GW_001436 [Halieaceae bacterium]|jgi:hypothetical protein